jgi:transcription initiation factor TFIIB
VAVPIDVNTAVNRSKIMGIKQRQKRSENRSAGSHETKREQQRRESDVLPHESNECPAESCAGTIITDDKSKEQYCEDCGLVIADDTIDHGPEWRALNNERSQDKSRVGSPLTVTIHDYGLTSHMGSLHRDGNGNKISYEKRQRLQRLETWDNRFRTTDSKQRTMQQGLTEVKRLTSALGVSDLVCEMASTVFRKASQNDLLPGRSIEAMAGGAVYAAARINEVSQTYDEITKVSRVGKRETKRAYMHLIRELNIRVPPTPPREYISRFGKKLDVETETVLVAESIATQYSNKENPSGAAPPSLAAAAVYTACLLNQEDTSQKEVGEKLDVSTVTIREFYIDMLKVYDSFDFESIENIEEKQNTAALVEEKAEKEFSTDKVANQ